MGKQKRGERGSSSSSQGEGALDSKKVRVMSGSKTEEDEHGVPNAQQTKLEEIGSSIYVMNAEMKENFSKLNILRYELKKEIDAIKSTTEDLEKSMEEVWESIDGLKENDKAQKAVKAQQQSEADGLKKEVGELRKKLEEERERNIELENYTRRENIKLMNIPETENRDITTRDLVYDLLSHDLNVDTNDIRFHAVHRVGKPSKSRIRPIIARFVCREDRDHVFRAKRRLQESSRFRDVYITADYAKAIQDERRVLVKAMFKAREMGRQAKVIDRFILIDNQRFSIKDVPNEFKPKE